MSKFVQIKILMCALAFICSCPDLVLAKSVHFKDVQNMAKKLASKPYEHSQNNSLPAELKNMGYDQWRDLRFKDAKSLWGGEGSFKVHFFHPGFIYNDPVTVNYNDETGAHTFKFSADLFDYAKTGLARYVPVQTGFAGFRVHYPLNRPEYFDEVVAFLGASYFRALPKGLFYGMSVRGLAINTATDSGEEFPSFKEFWIQKPRPNDKHIIIYALLDSPSVAGAYEYIIRPGDETIMDVKSTLFIRQKIEKLGIAPLTSMYFYGENDPIFNSSDFRPEVHDSDGVLIKARSGEWLWRPLDNPARLSINSFYVNAPHGFGLVQRDTNFDHYQDLEARYDLRPSVWVDLKDDWGAGHVELLQIPTPNEYNDNMNVFWVPEKAPQPGQILKFSYRLHWRTSHPQELPLGYVTDTRLTRDEKDKNLVRFLIDFKGESLNTLALNKNLDADLSVSKGYTILNHQIIKNTATNGWRLVFQLRIDEDFLTEFIPSKRPAAELRAFFKQKDKALTETWTYTFVP